MSGLCGSAAVSANTDKGVDKTLVLEVAAQRVACVGVGPQQCLQVRSGDSGNYQLFYQNIEGFAFEAGYVYRLKVAVTELTNPPADGSSLHYRLLEQLDKHAVDTTGKANSVPDIEAVAWRLLAYRDAAGTLQQPPAEVRATLQLDNGRLAGAGGCNRFMGSYSRSDANHLSLQPGGMTMMACPGPGMVVERDYLAALGKTASFHIGSDAANGGVAKLELLDEQGRQVAVLGEDRPPPLVGTAWHLQSYLRGSGMVSSAATQRIDAHFGEDGEVSGSSGCNRYVAAYQLTGESLSIGVAASTRKLCHQPQDVMEVEQQFLAALAAVARFRIADNTLTLLDSDGKRLALFRPASTP